MSNLFKTPSKDKGSLWLHAEYTVEAIEAILGARIGNYDKSITHIQDNGIKNQGEFYIDSKSGILYECIKSTEKNWCSLQYFREYSLSGMKLRQNIASCNVVSSLGLRDLTFVRMDKTQACEKVIDIMIKRASMYTERKYTGELLEIAIMVNPSFVHTSKAFELEIPYPGRLIFKYMNQDLYIYYYDNSNLSCSIAHYDQVTGIFIGWKKIY